MGHRIFISYKFHDTHVYQHINHSLFEARAVGERTPRDYVNVLETYIKEHSTHYYKAEEDNEPLDGKSDDDIWDMLKDKMFDSTMTIVLISPCMKENKREKDQWIPREIQYSLGIQTRNNASGNPVRSNTNAMIAIVLPDENGKYDYYFEDKKCCPDGCRVNKTSTLFYILKKNVFNLKDGNSFRTCEKESKIYSGDNHSFIPFYKWCDVNNEQKLEKAIEHSFEILNNREKYDICHEIEPRSN